MCDKSVLSSFNPSDHGLDATFKLTNFTELKGWGCKVPQAVLLDLLKGLSTSQLSISNGDTCNSLNSGDSRQHIGETLYIYFINIICIIIYL